MAYAICICCGQRKCMNILLRKCENETKITVNDRPKSSALRKFYYPSVPSSIIPLIPAPFLPLLPLVFPSISHQNNAGNTNMSIVCMCCIKKISLARESFLTIVVVGL